MFFLVNRPLRLLLLYMQAVIRLFYCANNEDFNVQ